MSSHLRWEQACSRYLSGKRCKRPAQEPGGMCSACWRSLDPSQRAVLNWEATWAIEIPEPSIPSLSDWDILAAADAMLGEAMLGDQGLS
jgi:hypothetical protein